MLSRDPCIGPMDVVKSHYQRALVGEAAEYGTEGTQQAVALDLPFGSHELPMNRDADLSEQGIIDTIARFVRETDKAAA